MSPEKLDYSVVLADLEAKRAALDAAIFNLRVFLAGQPTEGPVGVSAAVAIPTGEVPAGAFLGKSIPEAAKLYLQIMKRKATSKEMAEALRKGGIESTSGNFHGIVHAILNRARKSGGEIVKLDRSHWGLAEWYPAGIRSTAPQERRRVAKKGRRRPKATKAPKAGKLRPEAEPAAPGLEKRIEALLMSDKGKIFQSKELADALGVKVGAVILALGRMAAKNKAEKAQGGYRAFSGKVQEMPKAG